MKDIPQDLKTIDLYLLDQLFKGSIQANDKILDAGCGSGRNIKWLLQNQYKVTALDPKEEVIQALRKQYPEQSDHFFVSSLEDFKSEEQYDFIICNAVLHFARDHQHFDAMFNGLVKHLAPNSRLFIRMTTNIGIENMLDQEEEGVHHLPDQTTRYLITRNKIEELLNKHQLKLAAPIKTVVVDGLRSMGIFVFSNQ